MRRALLLVVYKVLLLIYYLYICIDIKRRENEKDCFVYDSRIAEFWLQAQDKYAEIKFDATSFDFGKFYSDAGKQSHTFTFTNTGNMPLIINQAMTSCGCTVSTYTKEPVAPGKTGTVNVTYNGLGKFPGKFKKSVTLRTNSKTPMVRLYIEGNMEERK